jgi:hypothetical protein
MLAVAYSGALWASGAGYYSAAGIGLAVLWRVLLRNGNQAEAEMAAMDTITDRNAHLNDRERVHGVWKAYYYLPTAYVLGLIIVRALTYFHISPYYDERFWDVRRRVEAVSGALVQAPMMTIIMWVLGG